MNPYETPKSEFAPPPPLMSLGAQPMYWAEGDLLVCRTGAVLPPVCLKTNEPVSMNADPKSRKKATPYYVPPWVFVFVLLRVIGLLIAYFIFRRPCRLEYSLSAESRRKYFRRGLTSVLLLLLMVAAIFGYLDLGGSFHTDRTAYHGALFVGGILCLITALVFAGAQCSNQSGEASPGPLLPQGRFPGFSQRGAQPGGMNPYEPPKTLVEPVPEAHGYRLGKRGIIGGPSIRLPRRCICTNQELGPEDDARTRRREYVRESWTGRRCFVEYSISPRAQLWRWGLHALGWLMFIAGISPAFLPFYILPGNGEATVIIVACGLLMVFRTWRSLHLESVWDHQYYVTGFSRRFLNSLRSGQTDVDP